MNEEKLEFVNWEDFLEKNEPSERDLYNHIADHWDRQEKWDSVSYEAYFQKPENIETQCFG
jgi:hypothetical protein